MGTQHHEPAAALGLGSRGQPSGGGKRLASAHCSGRKAAGARPAAPMARPVADRAPGRGAQPTMCMSRSAGRSDPRRQIPVRLVCAAGRQIPRRCAADTRVVAAGLLRCAGVRRQRRQPHPAPQRCRPHRAASPSAGAVHLAGEDRHRIHAARVRATFGGAIAPLPVSSSRDEVATWPMPSRSVNKPRSGRQPSRPLPPVERPRPYLRREPLCSGALSPSVPATDVAPRA